MSTIKLDITKVFKTIEKYISHDYIPYLMGPSGIGKTEMSEQLAKTKGWKFRSYDCSYADFADWGLYVKKSEQFVSMADTPDERVVKKEVVEAVIPEHMNWLFDTEEPTLVLVDELPLAPEIIQGNLMCSFNQRLIRGRRISDNIYFIVAGNRPQDRVGGNPLKWPLLSRMAIFETECGLDYMNSWADHAISKGVNPLYINVLSKTPDLLTNAKPNTIGTKGGDPRAWFKALRLMTERGEDTYILSSLVGEDNAIQFMGALDIRKEFPDVQDVLNDPRSYTPHPDRMDLNYAFGSALAYHSTVDNFDKILDVIERMPEELKNRIVKDCALRNKELTNSPLYIQWCLSNN